MTSVLSIYLRLVCEFTKRSRTIYMTQDSGKGFRCPVFAGVFLNEFSAGI